MHLRFLGRYQIDDIGCLDVSEHKMRTYEGFIYISLYTLQIMAAK